MRRDNFEGRAALATLALVVSLGMTAAVEALAAQPETAPAEAPAAPTAGTPKAPASFRSLPPADFRKALDGAKASGAVLVDVREPEETAEGYVPEAQRIPWSSGVFATDHGKLPKNKPIFIYCRSGGRAKKAAEMLVSEGWTDVTTLVGGYQDLRPPAAQH